MPSSTTIPKGSYRLGTTSTSAAADEQEARGGAGARDDRQRLEEIHHPLTVGESADVENVDRVLRRPPRQAWWLTDPVAHDMDAVSDIGVVGTQPPELALAQRNDPIRAEEDIVLNRAVRQPLVGLDLGAVDRVCRVDARHVGGASDRRRDVPQPRRVQVKDIRPEPPHE